MDGRRGFTLIELLIVIGVSMILSVVGLVSYTFSIQKSRDVVRKNDLAQIAKSLEAFANDFGSYPNDNGSGKINGCDFSGSFQGGSGSFSDCTFGVHPFIVMVNGTAQVYLQKLPNDPLAGRTYYYKKTTTGFVLLSILENTKDPYYKSNAGTSYGTISCGGGVSCNYAVTESGPAQ